MVQERKPDGKFGGKAPEGTEAPRPKKTDIRKNDVDNAIRFVMDEMYCKVETPRPLQVETRNMTRHTLGFAEFIVYAMIGVTCSMLAFVGMLYIVARI
jgi:hypothetical protein